MENRTEYYSMLPNGRLYFYKLQGSDPNGIPATGNGNMVLSTATGTKERNKNRSSRLHRGNVISDVMRVDGSLNE